jgi:maltose O-acetyltransferase
VARLIKAARKSGQADPSGEVSEADRANSYGESTAAPNGDGTQRSTLTEELQAIRQHVHRYRLWLALANALPRWTMGRLRTLLFRLAGCRIPHGSRFLGRAWLIGPGYAAARLSVGTGCLIGHDVTFGLDGEISLGRNVSVGPYCRLYTATHRIGAHRRRMDPLVLARTIVVEDGVWIGMGALILPGVRLGAGSVVSAGAVVTRDVPPDTLVAGNPAIVVEALGGDS